MTIYIGFSHWKWWFSIVMLVYQRVLVAGSGVITKSLSFTSRCSSATSPCLTNKVFPCLPVPNLHSSSFSTKEVIESPYNKCILGSFPWVSIFPFLVKNCSTPSTSRGWGLTCSNYPYFKVFQAKALLQDLIFLCQLPFKDANLTCTALSPPLTGHRKTLGSRPKIRVRSASLVPSDRKFLWNTPVFKWKCYYLMPK
jgi:hypothetical protein